MGTQENIDLVRRAADEFINKGNVDIADQLFTDDYVWHPGDGVSPAMSRDMHKADYKALRQSFPDVQIMLEDVVASGDDKVVTRFTMRGTHKGALPYRDGPTLTPHWPPKRVTWTGITIHRLVDGKIAEGWISYDYAGVARQLQQATG